MAFKITPYESGFLLLAAVAFCSGGCAGTATTSTNKPSTGGPGGGAPGAPTAVNEYLYVGGYPFIDACQVNTGSGVPDAPHQVLVGGAIRMTATNPAKFLYAGNWQGAINAFSIGTGGVLTLVNGSPFALPVAQSSTSGINGLALTADDSALYVISAALDAKDQVMGFRTDPNSGTLTALENTFTFGNASKMSSGSGEIIADQAGQNVYAGLWFTGIADPNGNDYNGVAAFSIDPVTKELTQLAGSPYTLPSGSQPLGMVINPSGQFLCVALGNTNQIEGYARDSVTGRLTPAANNPISSAPYLSELAMHPSGSFLFALSHGEITTYAIDSHTGALTQTSVWTASSASACLPTPAFVIDPTGNYIYSGTGNSASCIFQVKPTTGQVVQLKTNQFAAPNGDGAGASIAVMKAQ